MGRGGPWASRQQRSGSLPLRPGFRATARVAPTAENGPGALARQSQAQKRNRISSNFLPTQAPSGAGRDRTWALLISRAGSSLPASRGIPRNGDRGKATMSTKCSSGAVPRRSFGYFPIAGKVTRRPQTAESLLRLQNKKGGGGKPPPYRALLTMPVHLIVPLIRPLRGHLPPEGKAFWGRGPHPPQGEGRIKSDRQNPPRKFTPLP